MIRPRETQRATGASLSYDRPDDWRAQALCAEIGDADFYPLDGDHGAAKRAKAICADCDVRVECLAEAMRTGRAGGVVIPGSPEWTRLVTASKVAGILGLSPWDSPRTVWHRMRGELGNDTSNADAKSRGHYLESGVIAWWCDQHPGFGWLKQQEHLKLGDWGAATPDGIGQDEFGNEFVMDAKTAATDDDWGTPGTDEAPAYYVAQSMWQLACHPEAQVAYIAVLFGRPQLAFKEYVIERDDALIASIVARCRAFYESLSDDDAAPALSDMACEYDAIRTVHADIDSDAEVTLPDDLADRFLADHAHADRLKATSARVLDAMGNARIAKRSDGLILARRQPRGDAVNLVRVAALPDLTEGIAS